MGAYDAIKAALETAGNAAGGLKKVLFGTPGNLEQYPDPSVSGNEGLAASHPTGSIWGGDLFPSILSAIGDEMDTGAGASATSISTLQGSISTLQGEVDDNANEIAAAYISWGFITTNATTVAPSLTAGRNISAVSKNETDGTIKYEYANDYKDSYYFATGMLLSSTVIAIPQVYTINSGYVELRFYNEGGTRYSINTQLILVLSVGAM